jgi:hypothetical protein
MLKHYFTSALRNFRRHWVTTSVNVFRFGLGLPKFTDALNAAHYFQ